ncbi:hypothetical protein SMC27_001190 [Cronobacter malonaticus]|nr:hypothetical protein [Cronobacter malonaticus]MDT3562797.1 hypothetical protein [Cronobacter malonaticus]HAU5431042.1 hypothetical protein [Cronobacter malonaticus]
MMSSGSVFLFPEKREADLFFPEMQAASVKVTFILPFAALLARRLTAASGNGMPAVLPLRSSCGGMASHPPPCYVDASKGDRRC